MCVMPLIQLEGYLKCGRTREELDETFTGLSGSSQIIKIKLSKITKCISYF